MDTLTIIFALSLLGIIFMIAHKIVELKWGRSFLFADLRPKLDRKLHQAGRFLKSAITLQNLWTFLDLVFHLGHRTIKVAKEKTEEAYYRVDDIMKERAVLKTEGNSASFFLKNVSEYKNK